MKAKFVVTAVIAALLAVPVGVFASQPDVRVTDLAPQVAISRINLDLALLLVDPAETAALSIELPTGFTALDTAADPFAI